MERAAAEFGALSEATVFLDYFKDLPDPRQRGKVVYPLDEVLLLCLLAVLGGAETFVDIARFGEKKLGLLHSPGFFVNGDRAVILRSALVSWRSTASASTDARRAEVKYRHVY